MGQKIPISTSFDLPDGRTVTIETGKLATQADGSVVVRVGDTMIFATAVSAKKAKEGQSFFPLSVDYQEKFAAAGRIPGNFFRRETKLSDYEVLVSRLVDRAIRPLFPDGYMNETQVILNLISGEKEVLPDAFAALAASAAFAVSDIPFGGPISEVRVARIDGELVINPNRSALAGADMDFIVAASMDNVMMVEGEAKQCQEKDLVEAIRFAHEAIKVQCQAQLDLAEKVGEKATVKRELEPAPEDEELKERIAGLITEPVEKMTMSSFNKKERKEALKNIFDEMEEQLKEAYGEEEYEEKAKLTDYYYEKIKKHVIRNTVLEKSVRLDGRAFDEIRDIWTEVDYLPSAHGSAVFTRGETQSLTSLTLGTKLDKLMIDNALKQDYESFILHYNFPGYSVGEVKPQRGPGRREVGHANLASRSLKQVLPGDTPYTIRIVSDILESNGSSSMATVCAGALALMDAGIPIAAPVSGIAMGMISDAETGRYAILSDILGDEDHLGDMDFKVTGTTEGITACQMDIKVDGLSFEVLKEALYQAKEGRLHILGKIDEVITAPREELKPSAPRLISMIIDRDMIGAVIGPGGKVVQEIQRETGATVVIEEIDKGGLVNIFASNKEVLDNAHNWIKGIVATPEVGEVYDGKVKSIMPFGAFIEFMPGKEGLLHISEIKWERVEKMDGIMEVGEEVKVKLLEIDKKTGKFRLSRKVLLPRPERPKKDAE